MSLVVAEENRQELYQLLKAWDLAKLERKCKDSVIKTARKSGDFNAAARAYEEWCPLWDRESNAHKALWDRLRDLVPEINEGGNWHLNRTDWTLGIKQSERWFSTPTRIGSIDVQKNAVVSTLHLPANEAETNALEPKPAEPAVERPAAV